MPATVGLAAVAAALLIWVEVAVWRAVTPVPPTMQAQEVAAILADVSAALFSVSGDPPTTTTPAAIAEDAALSLEVMARELDQALTGGAP
jgi:cob(I)alamin adenosyltransferase